MSNPDSVWVNLNPMIHNIHEKLFLWDNFRFQIFINYLWVQVWASYPVIAFSGPLSAPRSDLFQIFATTTIKGLLIQILYNFSKSVYLFHFQSNISSGKSFKSADFETLTNDLIDWSVRDTWLSEDKDHKKEKTPFPLGNFFNNLIICIKIIIQSP